MGLMGLMGLVGLVGLAGGEIGGPAGRLAGREPGADGNCPPPNHSQLKLC